MKKNVRNGISTELLRIKQANVFYNYTFGLQVTRLDLIKTSANLLKGGLTKAIFFSDKKVMFLNKDDKVDFEWLRFQGRQWDASWRFELERELPETVVKDVLQASELSFHEHYIDTPVSCYGVPYLRVSLPPIVLESDDLVLPLFASLKVFADGIAILSFQLDTTWDRAEEAFFIEQIVNLYKRYFKNVWVHSTIQRLDLEALAPHAFQDEMTIAGIALKGRKVKRLMRDMKKQVRDTFRAEMAKEGRMFTIGDEAWTLHRIAGSSDKDTWESTFNLCSSIYIHAVMTKLEPTREQRAYIHWTPIHWEGRPSVTLMRFDNQPEEKSELISHFGPSLSRILLRSAHVKPGQDLPVDLRPFEDYSLHGNRAILLWTWTRKKDAPRDAWEAPNTRSLLMEHQARSEHIEYHNMRLVRACAIARSPLSEQYLVEAYETLAMADDIIHHSSQVGEVIDALKAFLGAFGTMALVPSAKEAARWYLDRMRYIEAKRRIRVDHWMTIVFGLVGTVGLAEFLVKPFLEATLMGISDLKISVLSFVGAAAVVLLSLLFACWSGPQRFVRMLSSVVKQRLKK